MLTDLCSQMLNVIDLQQIGVLMSPRSFLKWLLWWLCERAQATWSSDVMVLMPSFEIITNIKMQFCFYSINISLVCVMSGVLVLCLGLLVSTVLLHLFKHFWVGVILQKQISHFCELPKTGGTGHNLYIL